MASSIAQQGGSFNGSNFVQSADGNEDDDFDMGGGDGVRFAEALDRGEGRVSLKRCAYIDFTPGHDESDLFCFFAIVGGVMDNRNAGLITVTTTQRRVEDHQHACQTLQNEILIEDFKVSIR